MNIQLNKAMVATIAFRVLAVMLLAISGYVLVAAAVGAECTPGIFKGTVDVFSCRFPAELKFNPRF